MAAIKCASRRPKSTSDNPLGTIKAAVRRTLGQRITQTGAIANSQGRNHKRRRRRLPGWAVFSLALRLPKLGFS
jgi:hypothetical protein